MRNPNHPNYTQELLSDLAEAEADIKTLIHYARCALPTLFYIIEDTKDWRRDIRDTLHRNLLEAVEQAQKKQIKRKVSRADESPEAKTL